VARARRENGTRWLTDREQSAWRAFLTASQMIMDQLERELQRDASMPHAYYGILVTLSEQSDRRLRMTDLARRLRYSKTRLSEAIGRIEARGWVRREPCASDRRSTYAVLTEDGFAALAHAAPGHAASVRRHVFDRLTPDQIEQMREIGLAIAEPLLRPSGAFAELTQRPPTQM
jgi:DNA-binding MarR family transcriptional regulator